jgi:hypothetical protein
MYVFFCNARYIHSGGPFQNGANQRVLVFYCSVHLHLFETPLNGPLFWALDKKDIHMLLKEFGDFNTQHFMNLFSKSGQNRSQKTFYERVFIIA